MEAVELINNIEFDLVIADIYLDNSERDGIDVATLARMKNSNTQVIIFTGKPDVETKVRSQQIGAFDYLSKPINHNAMIRCTRVAIDKKHILDEKDEIEKRYIQLKEDIQRKCDELSNEDTCIIAEIRESIIQLKETDMNNRKKIEDLFYKIKFALKEFRYGH